MAVIQVGQEVQHHPEHRDSGRWKQGAHLVLQKIAQHRHMGRAFRCDPAILGEMPPEGVDQLGALPDQKVAGPEEESRGLLLLALDGDKAHRRTLRRLADRLSIDGIVLVSLHERLDVGRRDQPHLMAQRHQFAGPVMRTAAGLQSHQAGRLGCKEAEKLCPAQPLAEDALPTRIRTMRMKHVLRDVQADRGNLGHGRLPRLVLNTTTLAQRCRRGGVHPITQPGRREDGRVPTHARRPDHPRRVPEAVFRRASGTFARRTLPRCAPSHCVFDGRGLSQPG